MVFHRATYSIEDGKVRVTEGPLADPAEVFLVEASHARGKFTRSDKRPVYEQIADAIMKLPGLDGVSRGLAVNEALQSIAFAQIGWRNKHGADARLEGDELICEAMGAVYPGRIREKMKADA